MTETPEDPTAPIASEPTPQRPVETKPNRLYQAVAWVAIVAGTLFIVAVIFFSGFILGKSSDGPRHFGPRDGHSAIMERHGPPPGPMLPGAPADGERGPGQGPGR